MKQVSKQNVIVLLCIACLYCVNRFWLKETISLPVISYVLKCHFNDFLAGIAILAYINLMLSISKYHNKAILTFPKGFGVALGCGLLWEYLLPIFFPHGTSDIYDVLAYLLGGVSYISIIHLISRRTQSQNKPLAT